MFCVDVSEYVPVAVICNGLLPTLMVGLAGVTAIDCSVGGGPLGSGFEGGHQADPAAADVLREGRRIGTGRRHNHVFRHVASRRLPRGKAGAPAENTVVHRGISENQFIGLRGGLGPRSYRRPRPRLRGDLIQRTRGQSRILVNVDQTESRARCKIGRDRVRSTLDAGGVPDGIGSRSHRLHIGIPLGIRNRADGRTRCAGRHHDRIAQCCVACKRHRYTCRALR